jgi:hypothetical protein
MVDEVFGVHGCPKGAIGYVQVVKDGFIVGGYELEGQPKGQGMTAWFWSKDSRRRAVMFLDLRPDKEGRITLHAFDGLVRIYHGVFCAFPSR